MKLDVKRYPAKTVIYGGGKPIFIIKSARLLSHEKIILRPDGTAVYSIRRDPKPLDRRVKYIFTDCAAKNEFFAWVNQVPKRAIFSSYPIKLRIEAESFFGELDIKRVGTSKFAVRINGSDAGTVTRRSIECSEIDDAGLLAVLYVLCRYILSGEEYYRAADAI